MTSRSIGELWQALIAAWNADADLVALLANSQSIYWGHPRAKAPFPLIVFGASLVTPNVTASGLQRGRILLRIYADSPLRCLQIDEYLQEMWQIPTCRNEPVSSDHFRLTQLLHGSSSDPGQMGPIEFVSDESLYMLISDWDLRSCRKE